MILLLILADTFHAVPDTEVTISWHSHSVHSYILPLPWLLPVFSCYSKSWQKGHVLQKAFSNWPEKTEFLFIFLFAWPDHSYQGIWFGLFNLKEGWHLLCTAQVFVHSMDICKQVFPSEDLPFKFGASARTPVPTHATDTQHMFLSSTVFPSFFPLITSRWEPVRQMCKWFPLGDQLR